MSQNNMDKAKCVDLKINSIYIFRFLLIDDKNSSHENCKLENSLRFFRMKQYTHFPTTFEV